MNKKLISAAVLAGLASTASAVNVNSDGVGQLLLYPYYSASNGNATNIAIVNTTAQTKAVKVRFSEGGNSWEVMDFNLYLSPYDVWTGGITMAQDDSAPMVYTNDTSCTAPELKSYKEANADADMLKKQSFKTLNIDTFADGSGENTKVAAADRIKEGYIEVIEMGNIVDVNHEFAAAIKHDDTGVPADCEYVREGWSRNSLSTDPHLGVWYNFSNTDVVAPSGGLFGIADIINVDASVDRAYDALALDNVYAGALHSEPGTAYPDLGGNYIMSSENNVYSNSNVGIPTIKAQVWDAAGVGITDLNFQNSGNVDEAGYATIQAITAILQTERTQNYFYSDPALAAKSDWVVTFPTKHEFVNTKTIADGGRMGKLGYVGVVPGSGTSLPPFTTGFNIPVKMSVVDNEEKAITAPLDFSPAGSKDLIPFETNVLSFSDESILNSNFGAKVFTQGVKSGWALLEFTGTSGQFRLCESAPQGPTPKCMTGLPVIGFGTTQVYKGAQSYSTLYNHKYARSISQ